MLPPALASEGRELIWSLVRYFEEYKSYDKIREAASDAPGTYAGSPIEKTTAAQVIPRRISSFDVGLNCNLTKGN